MAARAAALKEMTFGDRRQPQQQQQESSNPNIVSSLVQDPKSDYLGAEDQYIADVPELQQTLGVSRLHIVVAVARCGGYNLRFYTLF